MSRLARPFSRRRFLEYTAAGAAAVALGASAATEEEVAAASTSNVGVPEVGEYPAVGKTPGYNPNDPGPPPEFIRYPSPTRYPHMRLFPGGEARYLTYPDPSIYPGPELYTRPQAS